jgi:hypothetical protein
MRNVPRSEPSEYSTFALKTDRARMDAPILGVRITREAGGAEGERGEHGLVRTWTH